MASYVKEVPQIDINDTNLQYPNNVHLNKVEAEIAQKLKEVCDDNGKETDPLLSAPLLHQLGQVYEIRGTDDMLCLIKSAALFNAAIARCSKSDKILQIEEDLQILCQLILRQAGAEDIHADLIKKSKEVKTEFLSMRKAVNAKLETLPQIPQNIHTETKQKLEEEKINFIRALQEEITAKYTDIMADLAKFCEEVLGETPCEFALAGMGSLARKEITPYSDFENLIVLRNETWYCLNEEKRENVLHYFRWYSVIFQTTLINLQETIIPSVAISSLNDYLSSGTENWFFDQFTTRGISFDGMMPHACKFPLGRLQLTKDKPWKTELIKPVMEMLEYLHSDESLKNGYHLGDILTKTCFVYGDPSTYQNFEKGVNEILDDQTKKENMKAVKNQIVDDLKNFATKSTLFHVYLAEELNIKKVAYRSLTLFVTAIGRIFNVNASSCFDIIEKLEEKHEFSQVAKHKLFYGVAMACEIRLRWYMKSRCQIDIIKKDPNHSNLFETFFGIIGTASTFSYFQIAYALQCDVSKRLDLKKLHFYSNPHLLNISICLSLYDPQRAKKIMRDIWYEQRKEIKRLQSFDDCIQQLENDSAEVMKKFDNIPLSLNHSPLKAANQLHNIGYNLQQMGVADDALEYFHNAYKLAKNFQVTDVSNTSKFSSDSSLMTKSLNQLSCHSNFLKSDATKCNSILCQILCSIGSSYLSLHKYSDSLNYFNQAHNILQQCKLNNGYLYSELWTGTGECLLNMHKPEEAIKYFDEAQSSMLEPESFEKIGCCFYDMKDPRLALKYFSKALKLHKIEAMTEDVQLLDIKDNDLEAAECYQQIGKCLVELNRESEAKKCFERALEIQLQELVEVESDSTSASLMHNIGFCLFKIGKAYEAVNYFRRSLYIEEQISLNAEEDLNLVPSIRGLAQCLLEICEHDKAMKLFERLLSISEKSFQNTENHLRFSNDLREIGRFISIVDSRRSFALFEQSLEISENLSLNPELDIRFAKVLLDVGCFYLNINKVLLPLKNFDRAFEIFENASQNRDDKDYYVFALQTAGRALLHADLPSPALKYLEIARKVVRQVSTECSTDLSLAEIQQDVCKCLLELKKPVEAAESIRNSLDIFTQISVDVEKDENVVDATKNLGLCLVTLQNFEEAKKKLEQFLNAYKYSLSLNSATRDHFANHLSDLGDSYMNNNDPSEALEYFEKQLQIQEKVLKKTNDAQEVAETLRKIGCCWLQKDNPKKAKKFFELSLENLQVTSSNVETDCELAGMFDDIGDSLSEANLHSDAFIFYQRRLFIEENIALHVNNEAGVSESLFKLGSCCLELRMWTKALSLLQKSQEIQEKISCDLEIDSAYANTLCLIGCCFLHRSRNSEAELNFKSFVKINQNLFCKGEHNGDVFEKLLKIGECFLYNCSSEGIKYFDKLLYFKRFEKDNSAADETNFKKTMQKVIDTLQRYGKKIEATKYCEILQTSNQDRS